MKRQKHIRRRWLWVGKGRARSDASANQGMPRTAENRQKLERGEEEFSSEASERAWPCLHFTFRFLDSRTLRE